MTIFRYKKDGKLYKIYEIVRNLCMCDSKGLQAVPLYHRIENSGCHGGFKIENLDDFEVVAIR